MMKPKKTHATPHSKNRIISCHVSSITQTTQAEENVSEATDDNEGEQREGGCDAEELEEWWKNLK
jgi:hypothetical protein